MFYCVIASVLYHEVVQYSAIVDTVLSGVEAPSGRSPWRCLCRSCPARLAVRWPCCVCSCIYLFLYLKCFAKKTNPHLDKSDPQTSVSEGRATYRHLSQNKCSVSLSPSTKPSCLSVFDVKLEQPKAQVQVPHFVVSLTGPITGCWNSNILYYYVVQYRCYYRPTGYNCSTTYVISKAATPGAAIFPKSQTEKILLRYLLAHLHTALFWSSTSMQKITKVSPRTASLAFLLCRQYWIL